MALPRAPCIWDETELLLKASTEHRDQSLAGIWVRGYVRNMVCFPRLHIVSDNISIVARRFEKVPNVSFHQLQWPQSMLNAGLGHSIYSTQGAKRIHGLPAVYFAIQWPMMWADNFTSARHVLIFDTDTLPVLPLRCHHLFEDDERPIWHTWAWPKPPAWLSHVNAVFARDKGAKNPIEANLAPHADFMTFFPVVIPRAVLKPAREALARAYGCHFDEAWIRMKNPSYGDLLGKAAALLVPDSIKVVHCPAVGRIKELIPQHELEPQTGNECRDLITVVEHLKHPFRDCHTGHCHHLARQSASHYGSKLLEQSAAFQRGNGAFPNELYHYQSNRTESHRFRLETQVMSDDAEGRLCGMPSARIVSSRSSTTTTSGSTSNNVGSSYSGGRLLEGPRSPSLTTLGAKAESDLALLVYDNRYNSSLGPSPRHLLYRSAVMLGIPVHIGSLVPSSVRRWQPGDRELWLMRTLPTLQEKLVALLDGFDTVLMCQRSELVEKWRRLAGDGRILISTEKQLWPEEGTYKGERLSGANGLYPKPTSDGSKEGQAAVASSRYINIGALVGSPASLLSLLQCMETRYSSFPYQCPIRVLQNSSYDFVSTAPFRTRRIGSVRGNWGWEQACFHTYLVEQSHGVLPATCPHLVLDYRADFVLNFNKIGPKLVWPWADSERMRSPYSKEVSCLLHANGAGKYAMPVLHFWWDHVHAPDRAERAKIARLTHGSARATLLRNFSRDYVAQWQTALKPALLRETSALLMLKDALRSAPGAQ